MHRARRRTRVAALLSSAFVVLFSIGCRSGDPKLEEAALGYVKGMPAARLEPGLDESPFAEWLQKRLGPAATIEWEVNDCGEQSGDPSDRDRDLPMCVQAGGLKGDRKIAVLIGVGTFKRGIIGSPAVRFIDVEKNGQARDIDSLVKLAEELGAAEGR
jgi:hypothetical protein